MSDSKREIKLLASNYDGPINNTYYRLGLLPGAGAEAANPGEAKVATPQGREIRLWKLRMHIWIRPTANAAVNDTNIRLLLALSKKEGATLNDYCENQRNRNGDDIGIGGGYIEEHHVPVNPLQDAGVAIWERIYRTPAIPDQNAGQLFFTWTDYINPHEIIEVDLKGIIAIYRRGDENYYAFTNELLLFTRIQAAEEQRYNICFHSQLFYSEV